MKILQSSIESIKSNLKDGGVVVAVYGLGHVGLAISVAWLRAGAKVIGVDVNDQVVRSINNGTSPIKDEPIIPESIRKYVSEGSFEATLDGTEASRRSDVKIIAVPTILTATKKCDLAALKQVLQVVAEGLKRGDLVIIESSVPPLATATVAKPILERISKLRVEEDFGLAYSPERVFEGRVIEDIEKSYPKVIGGIGPKSTDAAAALYGAIAHRGVIKTTSPAAAELSKLFEGIYRDVNIALANELARFCGQLNIDFKEVREVANSQPFCHLHLPGFVGGWCIPFYPHFVLEVAKEKNVELPLTSLARGINEGKPQLLVKVADSVLKEVGGAGLRGSKVAILGLAFRADVADTRNSPSYEVIDLLVGKRVSTINAYDPQISQHTNLRLKSVHVTASADEATSGADLIIIMTDHSIFRKDFTPYRLLENASVSAVLIDARDILPVSYGSRGSENFVQRNMEGFHIFIRSGR